MSRVRRAFQVWWSFLDFDLITVHMTETNQNIIVYDSRYKISKKSFLYYSALKVGLILYNLQFSNIFGFYNLVSSVFETCNLFSNSVF